MRQFIIVLGLLALYLCCVLSAPMQAVVFSVKPANSVDSSAYTDVMTDLMVNGDFNVSDYLSSNIERDVDVITVAENANNGLFIYVYEPSYISGYVFTSINISMADKSQTKDFKNYKLTLINRQSKFCKYLVENLTVGEPHRYEISSIFRAYIDGVDNAGSGGNTVSEVSYPVGKIFTFVDGQLKVDDVEYIQITDKYVGFVRYYGGSTPFTTDNCDSHFVAFSTNKKIDKLLEADVYFQTRACTRSVIMMSDKTWFTGELIDNYSYMTDKDEVFYNGEGMWRHRYSWSRIQTAKEFIDGEDFKNVYRGALFEETAEYEMSEESKKEIENKQWVLRFFESAYKRTGTAISSDYGADYTRVFNVSILRLKFETDGKVYDLGVVDNKQTGSEEPDNEVKIETTISDDLLAMMKKILGIILFVAVLVLLAPFLPVILGVVVWVVETVFGVVRKFFALIIKLLKGVKRHE